VLPIDIRSYADLLVTLRARRDELRVSHETIDEVAGLQPGYASKLLAPNPTRRLGYLSLGLMLGGLGLRMTIGEDAEALARIRRRLEVRKRWVPEPVAADDTSELPWPMGVSFGREQMIKECARLRRENRQLRDELDGLRNRASPIPPLPAPRRRPKRVSRKARHKLRRRNYGDHQLATLAR
jgi:hypothetical protein